MDEQARFRQIYVDRALMNGGYQIGGYRRRRPMKGGAKKSKGKRHCVEYFVSEKGNARCAKYAKGRAKGPKKSKGIRHCVRYSTKGPTGLKRCKKYAKGGYYGGHYGGPMQMMPYYDQHMMVPGYGGARRSRRGGGPEQRRAAKDNCWINSVRATVRLNPGISWKDALQATSAVYRQTWPQGSSTYRCRVRQDGFVKTLKKRNAYPPRPAYWLGYQQVNVPKKKVANQQMPPLPPGTVLQHAQQIVQGPSPAERGLLGSLPGLPFLGQSG